MIRPDEVILKSLISLKDNKDFGVFYGWLEDSITYQSNISLNEENEIRHRWADGRLQELKEIDKYINTAREILESMQKKQPETGMII